MKSISWYKKGKIINVHDKMQKNYTYKLSATYGKNFDPEFRPELSPMKMLKLGIFEGKYMNDTIKEFPKEWFIYAKTSKFPNPNINLFHIKSRLSLQEWKKRGWIPITKEDHDVRGWFQWYCRYYIGRRDENVDKIQIQRWKKFIRHKAQVVQDKKNPKSKKLKMFHRPRQRQALLQWSYYPFV
jgi:hypothetical protein